MFPKRKQLIVLTVLALAVSMQPSRAEARKYRRHHSHRKHHYRPHPLWGRIVHIPRKLIRIIVSGNDYYYDDGIFYLEDTAGRYVVVAPPIGGIIYDLPPRHKRILVNGRTYYYYNDVYYVKHNKGYLVVDDPVYAVEPFPEQVKVISDAGQILDADTGYYTIHVPHEDGTYIPVVLTRKGDGYLGPQGEYYPDFPSIEQLKVMYAD